ncbi:MAG: coproporphyrinogen-III oxidase family protein [Candidatus Melainabacteria bacterium]|nr:coproporphyrinogen-III oxidase family protein [Candidatus Melainabacteria bacterium]
MNLYNQLVTHPHFEQRPIDYIRWYPKALTPSETLTFDHTPATGKIEGIYIHVPFCDQLCHFCPYNKRTSDLTLIESYVDALITEIRLYQEKIDISELNFIYFGGGTPSVLSPSQVEKILASIQNWKNISPKTEITFESHPSHLTVPYLKNLKQLGINRISSGIQAFDDKLLRQMGANHTPSQAFSAIEASATVMGHIAIDLLYRCEGQSTEHWMAQLKQATELPGVTHLSCYSLVLDDESKQPSRLEEAKMMTEMLDYLSSLNYTHYASCASGGFDFTQAGYQSIYETRHWEAPQASFVGLGPGALGYVGHYTTVNGLDVNRYIQKLSEKKLPIVSATLADEVEQMRRYFVLGVKTLQVPLTPFQQQFNQDPAIIFKQEFEQLLRLGYATVDADFLKLTALGRLFVDSISAIFFSATQRDIPHPEEPEIRAAELAVSRIPVLSSR